MHAKIKAVIIYKRATMSHTSVHRIYYKFEVFGKK